MAPGRQEIREARKLPGPPGRHHLAGRFFGIAEKRRIVREKGMPREQTIAIWKRSSMRPPSTPVLI
jgi:hypothetical protein